MTENLTRPKERILRTFRLVAALLFTLPAFVSMALLFTLPAALTAGCSPKTLDSRFPARPIAWHTQERQLRKSPRVRKAFRTATGFRRIFVEPVVSALAIERWGEARNVNSLDLLPDSSWFRARLGLGRAASFYQGKASAGGSGEADGAGESGSGPSELVGSVTELTPEQVAQGPARTIGPSALGFWIVTRAGTDRMGPYLVIQDEQKHGFVLRFDHKGRPGLATSAELLASLLLHAAGFNVPDRHMVFFHMERLRIRPGARFTPKTPAFSASVEKRPKAVLSRRKVQELLSLVPRMSDKSMRALATLVERGLDLGPFPLKGRRKDDPNDTTDHENRRELRGLKLLAAWLGCTGLDEHASEDRFVDRRVVHTLRHLRGCLGSDERGRPKSFEEGLGYVELMQPESRNLSRGRDPAIRRLPAVGWLPSYGFFPALWRTSTPHPAFDRATSRDLFWAGRILAAFTRKQIEAAVGEAMLPSQEARALSYLIWSRARKAARYGLSRKAPLGFFGIEPRSSHDPKTASDPRSSHEPKTSHDPITAGEPKTSREPRLCFTDLWHKAGFGSGLHTYRVKQRGAGPRMVRSSTERTCVPFKAGPGELLYSVVTVTRLGSPRGSVQVHLHRARKRLSWRIAGIRRL